MQNRLHSSLIVAAVLLTGADSNARWRAELAFEARHFLHDPRVSTQHGDNLSLSGEVEYLYESADRDRRFVLRPFFRLDQHDDARTHVDIREAAWLFHQDNLEVRLGVDKVFWGVTEVYHLVDVINQTDVLENPDGEQKLGQPMLKVSWEHDMGTLDFFVLPWFRQREYPSRQGRVRSVPRIADELSEYEHGDARRHIDYAVRWSKTLGDWDLGIAYFRGTAREPSLRPGMDGGEPVLIPVYPIIGQASIDLQGVAGDWLWKFEGLHRDGQSQSFFAATGGFEYTFYGVFDSAADIGLLGEVMWDERGGDAPSPFNRDLFVGLRWTANDVAGSELLAGVVADWASGTRFFNLEASRRFGNAWGAGLQARLWSQVDPSDPVFSLRDDDYLEFKLTRYF